MSKVELTEALLAKIAGWEAMKSARSLVAAGRVFTAEWTPPLLRGTVQEGNATLRAGLRIEDAITVENLCPCRSSRQWGTICAHSVALGLFHLHELQVQKQSASSSRTAPTPSAPNEEACFPSDLFSDEAGEPFELKIILPPNLTEAIGRGKIALCVEIVSGQKTLLPSALPAGSSFRVSKPELLFLRGLHGIAGAIGSMTMLSGVQFAALLQSLVGHPGITLGRKARVEVLSRAELPPIKAELLATGEIALRISIPPGAARVGDWIFDGKRFHLCPWLGRQPSMGREPIVLSRQEVPAFLNRDWLEWQTAGAVDANFRSEDFTLRSIAPRFRMVLTGGLASLQARLSSHYEAAQFAIGNSASNQSSWFPLAGSTTGYGMRDVTAETAAVARLLRAGFNAPDADGLFHLADQNRILNFFARDFPRLRQEWDVALEERLQRSTEKNLEWIEPKIEVTSSGVDWFDLSVAYQTPSGQRFSQAEIQQLVLSSHSHTRSKNGKLVLLDTGAVEQFQETLRDCNPTQVSGSFRVKNTHAAFVSTTIGTETAWRIHGSAAWNENVSRMSGQFMEQPLPLGALESTLRPYQKKGVAWLHFLRCSHFGGILADEMGLGKTLQALAFISTVRATLNRAEGLPPCLVVCPSSLVFNWLAEAKKFVPHLRIVDLSGSDRFQRWTDLADSDLAVTSYALLRRDAERYLDLDFDTVILDEAQHIKNRQTQNAQAVKSIRAEHRVVLTGTPMENSVLDLWSIFDFLMPGYLGGAQEFRERYEIPITREGSTAVQQRLARRLRPFVLRRRKTEVAPELPPRIEQVSYCEMSEEQSALYQQILQLTRKEVLEAVGPQGIAKNRMMILTALLRLRQVCCDARLLPLAEGLEQPRIPSGKMELFNELLEEVIDGGHRVLVFSQFVSLLHLLREKLQADDTRFCYLDGSTRDRAEEVNRFQGDASIPVFLISLKAGGVGLNLTGADTVIHFDPWWNPAVEDQATDRTHRIGQTRAVTSYKLITRGTVEEKILNLQAKKREMAGATFMGEEQLAEALTWEEIQELLE